MQNKFIGICAAVAGFVLSSQFAWSQTAPAASDNALAEIVVTAEKRVESAQKTPISMEVYSGTDLAQKGVIDMQSLSAVDTSLNFNQGGGEGYLTMRGVSSHDTTEIGSPSVPVVVDNFSSNRSWSLQTSLFDIERVEVLRGPQGTLYGHSATGGIINVITAKPTNDFYADGSVEYGNYNTLNATGTLNVPLSDQVQVRAAFSSRSHDGYRGVGYQLNGETPGKADDEDSRAGRVQIAFEPFENFRGRLTYETVRLGGFGSAVEAIPFNYQPVAGVPCASYLSPCAATADIYHTKPPLGDAANFALYGMPWQHIDEKTGKWEFVYDGLPGGAQLSYLGGNGLLEWHHLSAGGTTFSFLGNPADANGFYPARQYQQNEEPHTQNHEVRLTSASTGMFTWQTGLYYFSEDNTLYSHLILDPTAADAKTLLQFTFPEVKQTSKAVYAQGSIQINDTNKITLGGRYNKDDLLRTGTFDLIVFNILGIPEYGRASSSKSTWHVGYDWTPTNTNLVYAKIDTGYKPGGFDTCGQYNPENVTTGEIGSKNRFNDDRVQLNAAVFYDDYKDQQVTQFTSSCISASHTTNAGKSRIYGLETSFTALVTPSDTVDLNLSYLHARFVSFLVPPTIGAAALVDCARTIASPKGTNCDLSGNTLTQSPNLTVSAGYDHDWKLQDGKVDFRIEAKYTSKQYYDAFNFEDTEQDGYAVGNAYLNYDHSNWNLGVYVRNFTDKTYLSYAAEATGGNATEYQYAFGAPRTFGARLQVKIK